MRVLVVDQDSTMLEAIARALGDYFTIDTVTTKADCLDLLRSNDFEVVVACERLEDGSGLELLSQVAKKWPDTLRIFAAERSRLKLLKGRLGPFDLFRTLTYPVNATQMLSALTAAAGTLQDFDTGQEDESAEDLPPPEPPQPRRAKPQPPARSARNKTPSQTTGSPQPGGTPARTPARKIRSADPPAAATLQSPTARMTGLAGARGSAAQDAAGRARPRSQPSASDPLFEASRIAAAARSRPPGPRVSEASSRRAALLVGTGAVAVLACGALGFVLLNTREDPTAQTSSISVTRRPQFPPEVVKLVADTEAAFGKDDFGRARANVRTLRELAPNHPRLPFFESLLSKRRDVFASETAPRSESVAPPPTPSASASKAEPPAVPRKPERPPRETPKARSRPVMGQPVPVVASSHRQVTPIKPGPAPAAQAPPVAQTASFKQPAPGGPATASAATSPGARATATQPAPTTPSVPSTQSAPRPPAPITTAAASPPRPATNSFSGRTLEDSTGGTGEARLIHRVPPEYPETAARRGAEGVVELSFSVFKDGTVGNVTVVHSEPSDIFDHAAISAVRRWKYEPKKVNGAPVESRLQIRLQFKLGQDAH